MWEVVQKVVQFGYLATIQSRGFDTVNAYFRDGNFAWIDRGTARLATAHFHSRQRATAAIEIHLFSEVETNARFRCHIPA